LYQSNNKQGLKKKYVNWIYQEDDQAKSKNKKEWIMYPNQINR